MDHAGELPMLFAFESKRRYLAGEPRLRVLCGPEVEHKLKIHRLDEMLTLCKPVSIDWDLTCLTEIYQKHLGIAQLWNGNNARVTLFTLYRFLQFVFLFVVLSVPNVMGEGVGRGSVIRSPREFKTNNSDSFHYTSLAYTMYERLTVNIVRQKSKMLRSACSRT